MTKFNFLSKTRWLLVPLLLLTLGVSQSWAEVYFEDELQVAGSSTVSSRTGWTLSNVYAHYGSGIRLGTNGGYATIKAMSNITSTTDLKVTCYAAKWNNDAASLVVTVTNAKIENANSKTITVQKSTSTGQAVSWSNTYKVEFTITGASSATTIKFGTNQSGKRVMLGHVIVESAGSSCTNTVTVTKGGSENGSFKLNNSDATSVEVCGDGDGDEVAVTNITPNPGFELDEVSATVGTYSSETGKVTGITANCTISVSFKQIVPKTVHFSTGAGNSAQADLTEETGGEGITLPDAPATIKCAGDGWEFAGWAEEAVATATTEEPTLLDAGETYVPASDGVTLYAVYKKGDGLYHKVTTLPTGDDIAGKYMIVNVSAKVVMEAHIASNAYALSSTSVSKITNNVIDAADISQYRDQSIWTVTYENSKWLFYNAHTSKYFYNYQSGQYHNMGLKANVPSGYTLSLSDGYVVLSSADDEGYYVFYNNSSKFGATNSGSYNLTLFKLDEATYLSAPSCCTTLDAPTNVEVTPAREGASVSWTAVENASGYEYKLGNGEWTSTTNPASLTNLTGATEYTVYLRATGSGDYCDKGTATTGSAFKTLSQITAAVSDGAAGTALVSLTGADNTWYALVDAADNATIYLKATVNNGYAFDNWTTTKGELAGATDLTTTLGGTKVGDVTVTANFSAAVKEPVGTPTGMNEVDVTAISATLKWNAVANATGYTVTCAGATQGTITENEGVCSCPLTGLSAGTEYTWNVKALGNNTTTIDGDACADQNFTTVAKQPTAVVITTPASKLTYVEGESFVATGMVVRVTYNTTEVDDAATNYTVSPVGALAVSDDHVTISVTMGGETASATQAITVLKKYTLTFMNYENGAYVEKSHKDLYEGAQYGTLPKLTISDACDPTSTTFMGWSANKILTKQATAPTYAKANDVMGTADVVLYAVWAYGETSSGATGFVNTVSVGDVVAFVEVDNGTKEMTDVTTNTYGVGTAYTTTPAASLVFEVVEGNTVGTVAFKFVVGNTTKYLSYSGSSNSLNNTTDLDNTSSWNVTEDTDNDRAIITNVGASGRKLMWNVNNARFACYTNKSHGNNNNQFYYYPRFYAVPQTAYSDYVTECNANVRHVTVDANIENGSVNASPLAGLAGDAITLTATPDAGYQFGAWEVKDADDGDVTVTNNAFTMPDKDVTVSATFTAKPMTGLTLSANAITADLAEGSKQLTVTGYAPADLLDAEKTINWSSNAETVATVVDGVITLHSTGSAIITAAWTKDANVKATCTLNIYKYNLVDYTVEAAPATEYTDASIFNKSAVVVQANYVRSDDPTDFKHITLGNEEWTAKLGDDVIANEDPYQYAFKLADDGKTLAVIVASQTLWSHAITVTPEPKDQFVDNIWGTEFEDKTGEYTMPTIEDVEEAGTIATCRDHTIFIGWVEEANLNAIIPDNIVAGDTEGRNAANKKYYAVWAKEIEKTFKYDASLSTMAASGDIDSNVSFSTGKGKGTSTPSVNGSSQLVIYQADNGQTYGSYITFTAKNGHTLKKVELTTSGSQYGYNKATYSTGGWTDGTFSGTLSLDNIGETNLTIVSKGTGQSNRLNISAMSVTYTKTENVLVDSIAVCVPHVQTVAVSGAPTKTSYAAGETFDPAGLTVTATYTDNSVVNPTEGVTFETNPDAALTNGQTSIQVRATYEDVTSEWFDVTSLLVRQAAVITTTNKILNVGDEAWTIDGVSTDPAEALAHVTYSIKSGDTFVSLDNNQITALAEGVATITASVEDGANYLAAEQDFTVTVKPAPVLTNVVIYAKYGSTYYALDNTAGATLIQLEDGKVVVDSPAKRKAITWKRSEVTATVPAEERIATFYNAEADKYLQTGSTNAIAVGTSTEWKWYEDNDGKKYYEVKTNSHEQRTFIYRQSASCFKNYKVSNTGTDDYSGMPVIYTGEVIVKIKPTGEDPVSVVASDIIENTSVVVENGATLNVDAARTLYNLTVEQGGKVTTSANKLTVHDMTINAMGGYSTTDGKSGQVIGTNVEVTGDLYLEIKLCEDAVLDASKYYCISAPFDVSMSDGFYWGSTKLTLNSHFQLFEYQGKKRAETGNGWQRVSGTMKANTAYFIIFNSSNTNPNTIRLKAMNKTISNPSDIDLGTSYASTIDDKHSNWHGVANPTFHYIGLNQVVQIFDYVAQGFNPYTTENTSSETENVKYGYVVGTPIFVKSNATSLAINSNGEYWRAPQRQSERYNYCVRISKEGATRFDNQLYVVAAENASASYDEGKDVLTMNSETSNYGALIWTKNYGMRLAVEEAPMVNSKATYDLGIFAPSAGTYTISVAAPKENATLYLTKNGRIYWNLTMGACELDLAQGQNNEYGLVLRAEAPQVTTGVEQSVFSDQYSDVQKVIIDEHVYILRGGEMYDMTGKAVK